MLPAFILLGGFAVALAGPLVAAVAGRRAGWLLALGPLALLVALLVAAPGLRDDGEALSSTLAWAPELGLDLALRLDGLAVLFGVLICGVGAAVCVYAGAYLGEHKHLGRFMLLLLGFMAAMLGIVIADNLLLLYVCWEGTTITSWLLIGFEHRSASARRAAWQALIVTSAGGLSLLGGLVLLGQAAETWELAAILERGASGWQPEASTAILLLVLGGAVSKSALVPLHFWLPDAMEAPTPVSAYLHSATMVTAGVFLLARLAPVLSACSAWTPAVAAIGGGTAVFAAWMALMQSDIKRLLAYTTISALGMMTLALGIGGGHGARAAMALLVAHALYKGSLFMVAGAVDHGAGSRDLLEIGGLRRAMPWTAGAALLATLSMVGLPPTLGFIAEEVLVEIAKAHRGPGGWVMLAATLIAGTLYTAAGFVAGVRPFVGAERAPREPHEPAPGLWAPPLLLGLAGIALAFAPAALDRALIAPATRAVAGEAPHEALQLWPGVTASFLLGIAMLVAGAAIAAAWRPLRAAALRLGALRRLGPRRIYGATEHGVQRAADWTDRWLQHGYLPAYLLIVLLAAMALGAWSLLRAGVALPEIITPPDPADVALLAVIFGAAAGAVIGRSRVVVVASMSLVGYSVALLFARYSAPDLAMTQVLVETLLTVLVVLLLPALPHFQKLERRILIGRDAIVCLGAGALITLLMLTANSLPDSGSIADYYRTHSETRAGGRNIVNTILVNFRAGDTLGEVTVLAAAAVGVTILLPGRRRDRDPGGGSLILTLAARVLLPLLVIFALLLLLKGHLAPGGGFAAGLVLSAALGIHFFGNPRRGARELRWLRPRMLTATGLLIALASGAIGLASGAPLLEAKWLPWRLDLLGGLHPGTPLLFDFGVCLVAAGAMFMLLRAVEERSPWRS